MDTKIAKRIGDKIGVDWSKIDLNEFASGLDEEFEHGSRDPETNVTNDDPLLTGKIAWAHLKEDPKYYSKLEKVMNVKSMARKMVAVKGIESQIPMVIDAKRSIIALTSSLAQRGLTKTDLLPIIRNIRGLMNLSALFDQSQASGGESRVYSGREWIASCKYVIENLKYILYEAPGTESWEKDSNKALRNQGRFVNNAAGACDQLVIDIKRNARNNAQSNRRRS